MSDGCCAVLRHHCRQIALEVYNEGMLGGGPCNPAALGFFVQPKQGERIFRLELFLTFPQARRLCFQGE